MKVSLSRGLFATVDEDIFALLNEQKWCALGSQKKPYAARNAPVVNGKRSKMILMHREIMKPEWNMVVDHINGDTLDNRRGNLRVCTHKQNISASRSSTGISRFKGVTFDRARGKWVAQIKVNYSHRFLGRFQTEEQAALAYNDAAVEAFGAYAVLNKVETAEQLALSEAC